jgi:Spy/CpxP family protein refolding chaperone
MNKLLKIALASALVLSIGSVSASADAVKGQKLFIKKLKNDCGMNGAKFAAKHSQDEWKKINKDGKFKQEIEKICPNVKIETIKDSWIEHLYDFSFEYANDSGNVPSC